MVHRLIAQTFLDNPDNLPEVSHLDETRTNNCVSNLIWASPKDNSNMPLRKQRISEKAKKSPVICLETQEVFSSIIEAAKALNVNADCISNCCRGKQQVTGKEKLHFKYYD